MTAAPILWAVHVRGPDDEVPVASYDDAVRLADGLNWWWATNPVTQDDAFISAVPCLWEGIPERHAVEVAKLGAKGADYGMPPEGRVEELREKFFNLLVDATKAKPRAERLETALTSIAEFAHDRSTGPAIPDVLWEVRTMAYQAANAPEEGQ